MQTGWFIDIRTLFFNNKVFYQKKAQKELFGSQTIEVFSLHDYSQ